MQKNVFAPFRAAFIVELTTLTNKFWEKKNDFFLH